MTISGKKYKLSEVTNPEISFQSAISQVDEEPSREEEAKEADTTSPHFSSFFTSPRGGDHNRKTGCFGTLNVSQEKGNSAEKSEQEEYGKVNFDDMFSQLLENTTNKETNSIEKIEPKESGSSIMDLINPLDEQRADESTFEPQDDH